MPLPGISKLLEKASNYELISHKVQQAHVVSPAGLQNGASLLKEMRDGDQPGAVSEGLVDDSVSGALRHGGEMPCRRGGTALAERPRANSTAGSRSTMPISAASCPAARLAEVRRTRWRSSPPCKPPRAGSRCGCA